MIDTISIPFPHNQRGGALVEGAMDHISQYVGTAIAALSLLSLAGWLTVRRSIFKAQKETNDALERALHLERSERAQLTERFGRLQSQFDEQERRYNVITELNVKLQEDARIRDLTIADRDRTIANLNTEIIVLKRAVNDLQDRLSAIRGD